MTMELAGSVLGKGTVWYIELAMRRRIRENRERLEMTQKQVAERMTRSGASLTHDKVARIELGDRRVTAYELVLFADLFGVEIRELTR